MLVCLYYSGMFVWSDSVRYQQTLAKNNPLTNIPAWYLINMSCNISSQPSGAARKNLLNVACICSKPNSSSQTYHVVSH
jgi:hypothetical protein